MTASTTPTSRRALLAGAAGGVLAATVGSFAKPETTAAVDMPWLLGTNNATGTQTNLSVLNSDVTTSTIGVSNLNSGSNAEHMTGIFSTTSAINSAIGLEAEAQATDYVVGVKGYASGPTATTCRGVFGFAGGPAGIGVYGVGDAAGVLGDSETTPAVMGRTETGKALVAEVLNKGTGIGIEAQGRVRFPNRSGTSTIAAGKSSVKKTIAGVTSSNFAIATLGSNRSGRYVRAVVCSSGYITIYLNSTVSSSTKVTWLVLG